MWASISHCFRCSLKRASPLPRMISPRTTPVVAFGTKAITPALTATIPKPTRTLNACETVPPEESCTNLSYSAWVILPSESSLERSSVTFMVPS